MSDDGWYPVALAGGVTVGTSNGTRLLGEEIVVWRDQTGEAHIWEDRCPHRGMRLSLGFVRGDRIACLYHGWQYGTDGHCLYIPAHPDLKVPPSIVTWRHGSAEGVGMIWAHLGETAEAPTMPAEANGRTLVPVRSIHIDCPAATAAERLASADIVPFGAALAAGGERTSRREGALVVVTTTKGDIAESLIAGVQPIDDHRSALHLVVAASQGNYRGAGQRHFAELAETLRTEFESELAA